MHKLRLNGMKSAKKRQKSPKIRAKSTRVHASNSALIAIAAGAVVADYLAKNPDLMEVIARTHKESMQMWFAKGKNGK